MSDIKLTKWFHSGGSKYCDPCITLKDEDECSILSISLHNDDTISFSNAACGYHCCMPTANAVIALKEAIACIEGLNND